MVVLENGTFQLGKDLYNRVSEGQKQKYFFLQSEVESERLQICLELTNSQSFIGCGLEIQIENEKLKDKQWEARQNPRTQTTIEKAESKAKLLQTDKI